MKTCTDENKGWTYNDGRCEKCGKPFVYVGDVPLGGFTKGLEPYCTCNQNAISINSDFLSLFNNQGWTCPKCGKVFSPSIIECIYCNRITVTTTKTDTYNLEIHTKNHD